MSTVDSMKRRRVPASGEAQKKASPNIIVGSHQAYQVSSGPTRTVPATSSVRKIDGEMPRWRSRSRAHSSWSQSR